MYLKRKYCNVVFSFISLCFFLLIIYGCTAKTEGGKDMDMILTSSAFTEGSMIPGDYGCKGRNISPPLTWISAPEGTKSFALICNDPDASAGDWVHWVIYNIPATMHELKENISPDKTLENGVLHGINDFRKYGYGGPCPPGVTHRYYFTLYALDTELTTGPGLSKKELLKAMKGYVLAKAELMGKYSR